MLKKTKNKQEIIVILGQTATGKSALAVEIARKINGEIISADSRQVYAGLNIGAGKITKKEMKGIPHHLLDVTNPKKIFTVAEYQKLAFQKMEDIISRGRTPIICGGTGFYIDSITKGTVFPNVPPDENLRKQLIQKSTIVLFRILEKLDKRRATDIKNKNEQNNKVRLIRAIEIAKVLGKIPKLKNVINSAIAEFITFTKIGLYLPKEKLKIKIRNRLLERLKMGMLAEAKELHKKGLSYKRMKELGLEYKYMALYLEKKITKEEMIQKLETEIYKYAKRQMVWFKRDKEIKWIDASAISTRKILELE